MRSVLRPASTFLLALSLALGVVGLTAGLAQAAPAAPVPVECPEGVDINGLPTCPANRCGFLKLFTCSWHNVYVNGVWVGIVCAC